MSRVVGNFVLFQVLWFAAVLGAAQGDSWWALPVLFAMLAWTPMTGASLFADLRLVAIGLALGLMFEVCFIATGAIAYKAQWFQWAPPMWIMLLWAGFAMSFNHSMAWLTQRPLVAGIFGGFGAVLSLLAGVRLGAAEALLPDWQVALIYGFSWALLVPLLAWVARPAFGASVRPA